MVHTIELEQYFEPIEKKLESFCVGKEKLLHTFKEFSAKILGEEIEEVFRPLPNQKALNNIDTGKSNK